LALEITSPSLYDNYTGYPSRLGYPSKSVSGRSK